jgi:hypothetical protein
MLLEPYAIGNHACVVFSDEERDERRFRHACRWQVRYCQQRPDGVDVFHACRANLLAMAIVDDRLAAASFAAHVMLGGRVTRDASTPVADGSHSLVTDTTEKG